MFCSAAYAAGSQGLNGLVTLLPFVLVFVVMYFLMIRPQKKRSDAHKAMLKELKKGDKVVTIGGIIAKIEKIDEDEVKLQLEEGASLTLLKSSISFKYNQQQKAPTPQEEKGHEAKKSTTSHKPVKRSER